MDTCQEVQSRLDLAPASQPVASADAAHLRNCPTCQAMVSRRQQFDAAVRGSLQDVPVPTDLRTRLLTSVGKVTMSRPEDSRRASMRAPSWRTWLATSALLMAVACGAAFLLLPQTPQRLEFAELQTTLQQQYAKPADWSSLPAATGLATSEIERELARLRLSPAHGINLDQDPAVDAVLFSFRHQRWTGVIIAIPNRLLHGNPVGTTPQLHSQQRAFAWQSRSGNWTYVCYVHSGPPAGLMQSLFGGLA